VEGLGRLLPGQPLGPSGQKPGQGLCQRALGVRGKRPGHGFHLDPTPGTVDPSGRINKNHREPPKRDKRESPRGKPIIAGTSPEKLSAQGTTVRARFDKNLDDRIIPGSPLGLGIDEGFEFLDEIEDSDDLHPVSFFFLFEVDVLGKTIISKSGTGCTSHSSYSITSFLSLSFNPQIVQKSLVFWSVFLRTAP
jgi:hypothetical protein